MIFFGTNSSTIKTGKLSYVKCPHCENEVTMNYTILGKYAHLYWIPFFPTGKEIILECNHCRSTYNLKQLDQKTKDKFKQELEKYPAKTPVFHFSAAIIIALIAAFAFYMSSKNDDDTIDYGKNPKVGDVYHYEIPEMKGHYSTMKIMKITKDSVFAILNNMEIESKSNIDQILDDNNYTYPDVWTLKELKDKTKNLETFYRITRP